MQERIYLELKTQAGDVEAKLANVADVEKVQQVGPNGDGLRKLSVECTKGVDLREKLFRLAVENDWIILEMRKEQASLEDVFRQLTTS